MATAKPNSEAQKLSDKVSAIEKDLDKVKKLAQISTIVAMIAGSGGIFSVVTYFINYNHSVRTAELDTHSKEMTELRSTIDFLYQHGDSIKAKEYTNQLIALHSSYFDTNTISKPVSNNISLSNNSFLESSKKDSILNTLPNVSFQQYLGKRSGNKLLYSKNSNINASGSFEVTYDYLRYRIIDGQIDSDSTKRYSYKYGIGTRIRCDVTVLDKNINQSNLLSLQTIASLAEQGKVSATIKLEVLGIIGKDIVSKVPLPTNVDIITVTNYANSMKSIMDSVAETSTLVNPVILSIESLSNISNEEVFNDILAKNK